MEPASPPPRALTGWTALMLGGPGAVQMKDGVSEWNRGGHRGGRQPGGAGRGRSCRGRRVIQFSLTEEEFAEVSTAAGRSGLARGAFAAEATLAAARGVPARVWSPLREAMVELMTAAGLVRRVGTNLNQAVARLNATGQRGDDLLPAAEFCVRVIRRLDETAAQLRRSVP